MCISTTVSFGMGALLITGGRIATYKAYRLDRRYIPLALFPVFVGIQQFSEGLVWAGLEASNQSFTNNAALAYLFFAWLVWPAWVPYMTARLEHDKQKKQKLLYFAQAGLLLGIALYLPNFLNADWLTAKINHHSILYQCTLLTDTIAPRELTYLLYLAIIALPPIMSSHRALNIFGAGLVTFVPLTYFFFYHAHISVLCFFAAAMTFYIFTIILDDKCSAYQTKLIN